VAALIISSEIGISFQLWTLFRVTARERESSTPSVYLSPSRKIDGAPYVPSRRELKRREGSFERPLRGHLHDVLVSLAVQIIPSWYHTGTLSTSILDDLGSASLIKVRSRLSICPAIA